MSISASNPLQPELHADRPIGGTAGVETMQAIVQDAYGTEPEEVLRLVRLGVATRPGYELTPPAVPGRVTFFEIEAFPISSTELRARLDGGEDVHELLPAAVWELIERDGLYGRGGYTDRA